VLWARILTVSPGTEVIALAQLLQPNQVKRDWVKVTTEELRRLSAEVLAYPLEGKRDSGILLIQLSKRPT
jgi:hypothetical protein